MVAPTYPERVRGNTLRAWTGHRSVPIFTVTNMKSCVRTLVVITYVPRKGKWKYRTIMEAIPHEHGQVTGQYDLVFFMVL